MNFAVKPAISSFANLAEFLSAYKVGTGDLIVTNEFVLNPALKGAPAPCDTLFQEQYGKGEPSDEMVNAMLTQIKGKQYDRIIAIGGGTVIDIAKLFVFGSEHSCEEIFANGKTLPRKSQLLLLPTTCGTGSEVTNISIINFIKKDTKIGLAEPALYADEAILIAELLATMPYPVFAHASIDALIHAMESYVSPKANVFTRALGRSAIEQILAGYQKLTANGERKIPDTEDLEGYLTASTMAGIAFGNAGCAAVHALSYPIGSIYHVPHGKSNYLLLQAVFEAYKQWGADLSPLETALAGALSVDTSAAWSSLFALLAKVEDLEPISTLGIDAVQCDKMTASVVQNQQRLLANTPIKLTQAQINEIYLSCL